MNFISHTNQPPSRLQRKKELYKLVVARSDITASLNACKVMLEKVHGMGHELYYPLYSAIVVCYSRPFTNNKPYGSLAKKWYTFEDLLHKKTHKELLKARHELIAHSDMTVKEAMIVPPNVEIGIKSKKPIVSNYIIVQTTLYYYPRSLFENSKSLCLFQRSRISVEIDNLLEELYEGMDLPNAPFKIRMDNGL